MTALPSADLTDAEALTLARIEAEPDAPESLREVLARALYVADSSLRRLTSGPNAGDTYRRLADAAIDVMCGPTDDAWIVTQLRALLREQDPDAVPIIARADLEAIIDGDGGR